MLTPFQLQIISDVYYSEGFVLGRDKLYEHLQQEKKPNLVGVIDPTGRNAQFTSRDDVEQWLTFQPVNTIHAKQKKPRKIDSFKPQQPFHSLSIDLIDYSKNGSASYDPATQRNDVFFYILIIIDNYSRYMWGIPLINKRSTTVGNAFWNWYINDYSAIHIAPPIFVQMDNGGEFVMCDAICTGFIACNVVRSIPHVPQSNALVERSIGTLKRIMAKLIHIRHQGYIAITDRNMAGIAGHITNKALWQSWYFDLGKALTKYNNTRHGSMGLKPIDAINVNVVTPAQHDTGVARAKAPPQTIRQYIPDQLDLPLGEYVRLIRHKGRLGKSDKLNWSSEVYIITSRRFAGNPDRRTKYEIQLAHNDQVANLGVVVGAPLRHWYYKEHLNVINFVHKQ